MLRYTSIFPRNYMANLSPSAPFAPTTFPSYYYVYDTEQRVRIRDVVECKTWEKTWKLRRVKREKKGAPTSAHSWTVERKILIIRAFDDAASLSRSHDATLNSFLCAGLSHCWSFSYVAAIITNVSGHRVLFLDRLSNFVNRLQHSKCVFFWRDNLE